MLWSNVLSRPGLRVNHSTAENSGVKELLDKGLIKLEKEDDVWSRLFLADQRMALNPAEKRLMLMLVVVGQIKVSDLIRQIKSTKKGDGFDHPLRVLKRLIDLNLVELTGPGNGYVLPRYELC